MSGPPQPKAAAQQAIQQAVAFHRGGRLDDAERLYTGILQDARDHFDALHLLGVLMQQRGRSTEALALIDRALQVNASSADALRNHGLVLAALGRFDEALASFDRALALQADNPDALFQRGNALIGLDRPAEALASYDRALARRPDHLNALVNRGLALQKLQRCAEALAGYDAALAREPAHVQALVNRGNALMDLQRPQEALASYERALALRPDDAETLFNHGNALITLRRPADALASYRRSLALRPGHFESLFNSGNLLRDLGRHAEALTSYDCALAVRPDHLALLNNRGNVLCDLGRLPEALASFERALAREPARAELLNNRGNVLLRLNRPNDALASYDRALAVSPDDVNAHTNRGNALKELGRLAEAEQAYLAALDIDPEVCAAWFNLADMKTFAAGDPHIAAMQGLAKKSANLTTTDRLYLDFALGKAFADLKQHAGAFRHLRAGNAAKRAIVAYDEKSAFAYFDRIEAAFTPDLVAAKTGGGDAAQRPVFIIGMPRSGTTLIEQILASHPMVHGAGELQAFNDVVLASGRAEGHASPYPEFVPALDPSALRRIGARYLARLRDIGADGERVTDKMPSNYFFAGLIHLALPNATIIHSVRDPVDTCLSCFSKLFSSEQNHTYDLGELGRYYRRYRRLMAHWQRVLPAGRMLEVRYEDVIADLDTQARRIVAHCGLDWDDRCLAFHRTERPVHTASAIQVRQPIYPGAVGRWHAYEEFLGPLLAALRD